MENTNFENYNLSDDDFVLVQNKERIFDTALKTKPTTFLKDAFKRFCKNKSSVVAAYIIGIIVLLSIIVPILSPHDIISNNPDQTLLPPKLFEAGFGWWDGTIEIKGYAFDESTGLPYEYKSELGIRDIVVYEQNGVKVCDFIYDQYAEVYGETVEIIPKRKLENYVKKGQIIFDFENEESLEILDETVGIVEIVEIFQDADGNTRYKFKVSNYLKYGYDAPPKFLFGTNAQGRDILTLAFKGLQKSLIFAICIASICLFIGLIWGSVSGYFGGNVDLFMERFKDILGGVPTVVIVTLFRLHLGTSLAVFALALCITGWMGTASRTRTQFYRFKGREYVLASRTLGASDTRLIFRHILPNALGTIVTSSVLMIPGLIFTEATLSYLGLGLQGSDSFGTILSENQGYLQTLPMLILFPSIIVSLLMISFNLFGNGLRDALNPSLKGSE